MKVAVLSASPKQQLSLTLQIVRTLQKMCKDDEFDICFLKKVDDCSEFEAKAKDADLVLILSSLYHFNTHGQLMRYLKGLHLPENKPFTYITSSGGNMDVPAHNYLRSYARQNGLKWIRSLSMLDEDVLAEHGREEVYRWFQYVKDMVMNKPLEAQSLKDTRISVLDCGDEAQETEAQALAIAKKYEDLGAKVTVYNLREKNIKGCIACFGCYTNNKCVIKDDFEALADEIYKNSEMIITVSGINYNQFSTNYKYFLDRHVKFGRYGQDYEHTKAYVYCGEMDPMDLAELEQHTLVVDSLGHDVFVGMYADTDEGIAQLIQESAYACINDLYPQRNTYTYGLSLQFANLAYRLQNMTPNDYEYFKAKGYYQMPQVLNQVRPISNLEEGRMSCQMRLMAFEDMLSKLDGPPNMTKRGERSKFFKMIGADLSKNDSEKTKKGFSLFRKN